MKSKRTEIEKIYDDAKKKVERAERRGCSRAEIKVLKRCLNLIKQCVKLEKLRIKRVQSR